MLDEFVKYNYLKMKTNKTWSSESTKLFYDRLGKNYDWFSIYESRAKTRSIELLNLKPGISVLNVGIGTGKEHALIQNSVGQQGFTIGIDISEQMLKVSRRLNQFSLVLADARFLPFNSHSFDRIYVAYVLDLLPAGDLPELMRRLFHLLKPKGRMVLLSLTEGLDFPSRLVVSLWKRAYAANPGICGGCLPLNLMSVASEADLPVLHRETVVQLAVPSEIIVLEMERES